MKLYKYSFYYNGELYKFSGPDFDRVYSEVANKHNELNIKFDPASLKKSIERQSGSKVTSNSIPEHRKSKSLADIKRGAMALIKYTAGDSASKEEIKRRVEICKGCSLNQEAAGCRSCGMANTLTNFVKEVKNFKKVSTSIADDVKDRYCGICGCSLFLLSVTKMKDFYNETPQVNARRPDYCWLKENSPNFTHE
jgi:hypothetical protein